MSTIFALATARGKAGVAVLRISGPQADAVLRLLGGVVPEPRRVSLQALKDPDGGIIDEALVIAFEPGASFTGERVIELQTHGSLAVVNRLCHLIGTVEGVSMAEPGEFTRRALMAGRMDLAQVEGLADLIDAETEAQRRQAQRLVEGVLSAKAEAWRSTLVEARSLIEASIDFADEDLPVDVTDPVAGLLGEFSDALRTHLVGFGAAERMRLGFEVALVGPPNVGKSTLLNTLAGRDAAITSHVAGTTRDVIEVRMDVGGLPVTFLDTAGLRDTDDDIEAVGVQRTRVRAAAADLRVFLMDGTSEVDQDLFQADDIVLRGKADLHGMSDGGVSGRTGLGVEALVGRVAVLLQDRVSSAALIVNARQRAVIEAALAHVAQARHYLALGGDGHDMAGEEIRLATREIRALVGDVDMEQVYDQIFLRFCIGK